jgi:hypothetical protein
MMQRHDEGLATGFDDTVLRAAGVVGLFGIALIHFLDIFGKLSETPYLGVLYAVLIAVCVAAALALAARGSRVVWTVAGLAAAATIIGYVLSRSTGLPASTGDIGNWREPLGLASLFVEGGVVVLSGFALAVTRPARAPRARSRSRLDPRQSRRATLAAERSAGAAG